MDDLFTGSDSKDELLCIQHEITKLLSDYGFHLREWLCNEPKLLNEFNIDSKIDVSVLNIEDEACKTLGVFWDAKNDQIKYIMINHGTKREFYTKGTVLSIISQLFDPLGLLGPIIINAKLIMQDIWKEQVGWDEELPKNINQKWIHFKKMISRKHAFFSVYIAVELHGFCDSSILAYGACIYIRCSLSSNQFYSQLLCAKSRVAPLKQVSLPRLELCGCILLANLAKKVKESLRINFNKHYFWTDSMIALAWINNNPTKWKTFIANRVNWHHVKSQENPADTLSRGTTVNALSHSDLWWFGPAWLQTNNQNWEISEPVCMNDLPEMRTVCNLSVNESNVTPNYILNKFSSLETMLKQMVQHYWQRWRKEYLSELQSRMKWKQRYPELLKIGSLVVVKEDKSPPCSWPLVRLVALYPGQDGFTRVVKLKLKHVLTLSRRAEYVTERIAEHEHNGNTVNEIFQLVLSVEYAGDQLSPVNVIGLCVCLGGISCHVVHKMHGEAMKSVSAVNAVSQRHSDYELDLEPDDLRDQLINGRLECEPISDDEDARSETEVLFDILNRRDR
nr:unnamed protein product [Callosobruchus analis]